MEIPLDCIRKLADAMDRSYDERVDLQELKTYIEAKKLPFKEGTAEAMFKEASSGRGFITNKQMNGGLSHEEIAATVRGRHAWNIESKTWDVKYRPFRDYWIVLLLTVNPKIFALPMPKVVPSRIRAQYELEDEFRATQSSHTARAPARRHDKLYQSVTNIYRSSY